MRSSALRTTLGLACGLAIAVAANDAVAGPCPGEGDCCVANGTPGCDHEMCCSAICAIDPFCCDTEWDGICADEANADAVNCPQCQPAPTGACCIETDCVVVTEDACSAKGGTYQGDLSECLGGGKSVTYESFPNGSLPDNNAAGVSDTITVPDSAVITDVDVALQVTHTWVGDLCVTLVHQPTGTTVDLIQRMGTPGACHLGGPFGCAADNFNVVLDDAGAGGAIESQCVANLSSPPSYGPNNPLAVFNSLDSAGDWTLTVSDNAAADLGTFNNWSLIITSGGTSPCDALDLDIKPGTCPNPFNRSSHGVLPVALVGAKDFDVAQVDISSIQLSRTDGVGGSVTPHEGPPGPHSVFEDAATPFAGEELCDCHELEGDGFTDLSMKFKTDDVVAALQLNDLPAGDLVELILSGNLLDGTPFGASDCIRLVPPGTPPGVMAVGSNLSGVFIDVTPLDETLDGGGFANFNRTFSLGSVVTLTAPQTHLGWVFAGWSDNAGVDGLTTSDDAGPLPDPSIDIIIVDNQISVEAIYTPPVLGNSR